MSSLVMEIEDYPLEAGKPTAVSRTATYFLLMTGSDVDVQFSYKGSRIGGGVGLQGGDAVGPMSQAYDQVTLTSATAQTVKVATSSDPVTITRLSGTVRVDGVVETAPDYSRVIQNEAYIGSHTKAGVSGEYSHIQIFNPVGSGKRFIINEMFVRFDSSYDISLTDTEATATNLNGFSTRKGQSLNVRNPVVLSSEDLMRAGSHATTGVLAPSSGIKIGTYQESKFQGALPIVINEGAGVAFNANTVGTLLSVNALMFEVAL